MQDNVLVSVVMSVYDGDDPEFLCESIKSIVGQSYRNIEVILIGDGISKSNLISKIKLLEFEYNTILKYFPQEKNKGLASCMNRAIEIANGNFIARMDADDIMDIYRLEKQLSFLKENPQVDIVGSWILEFNHQMEEERLVEFPLNHDVLRNTFGKRNPVAHPSVMMRRSFFKKAGVYPLDAQTDEDTILWLNGFMSNCEFANIDEPLTKMRISENFYRRRTGFLKAYFDLKNRMKIISNLKLSWANYFYAFARFIIQIIPSSVIKRLAYNNLR